MEGITVPLFFVTGMAVIGSLIETYKPGFITEHMRSSLSAITCALIGILFSFLLLMFLLKVSVREGFEDYAYIARWKSMIETNKVEEVCSLYTEVYDKILTVEKGAPPGEQKTDAQAREATDKRFAKLMTVKPVPCKQVDELSKNIDSLNQFYLGLHSLSDTFLQQVYETATACRSLLIENYNTLQDAEKKRVEGFESLCSEKEAEEKRKYLETKKEETQPPPSCLIVEEISTETKVSTIDEKLNKLEKTKKDSMKANQDSIAKVLDDCKYYKEQLDKKKEEALALSNKFKTK